MNVLFEIDRKEFVYQIKDVIVHARVHKPDNIGMFELSLFRDLGYGFDRHTPVSLELNLLQGDLLVFKKGCALEHHAV
jgi:hypothetical protein